MEVVACSVVEVDGGRIRRERDYFDSVAFMEQHGVSGNR
jgi:limonene-1,2-epoxide hydrolase